MRWSRLPARARPSFLALGVLSLGVLSLGVLSLGVLSLGVLSLGLAPARAAPPACAPDLVGPWTGKVWDQGRLKELRTEFSTASGELTGSYHVEDDDGDGYDGTLTDFVPSAPCAGLFRWHDRYGDGVVRVDFRPERDRFDGEWGLEAPLREHIFNGRRFRPVPIG